MFLTILISVVISSLVTIFITLVAVKISTNVFKIYLALTEDRYDKKLELKKRITEEPYW